MLCPCGYASRNTCSDCAEMTLGNHRAESPECEPLLKDFGDDRRRNIEPSRFDARTRRITGGW